MERRFKRTPVKLVDHEGAHGVLRLHRRKTRLEVSSDTLIHFEREDENGWFDLVVRALDGREVLLHHAISLGTGFHQWGGIRDAHFARVFPNVVIDDLRGLASDRLVQRIAFRMTDMSSFFYYRSATRPVLLQSIARCRKDKAILLIARLDRLARSVAFVSSLMEGGVEFVAADNPAANKPMLQMLAVFAEYERDQIAVRTKAALAAAKARGVRPVLPGCGRAL